MGGINGVRVLETADDLLAFLKEDPTDRLFDYRNDQIVTSLRALGVTSVNQYVKAMRPRDSNSTHQCTLAVVAAKSRFTTGSNKTAHDIMALCKAAENLVPGRMLSWAGYEGLCVLSTHPDAEVGEAGWFTAVATPNTIKE